MSKTKPIRILYMEDDAGLARLLQKKLERVGYQVDVVPEGNEGLARCRTTAYDVVVVDQQMPGYEGLEVIRMLAAQGPRLPTIMITGAGNEQIAIEAMKLGASDYLVKDTAGGYLELLPTVIEQALHRQRLAQEKQQAEEELRQHRDYLENLVAERTVEIRAVNQHLEQEIVERKQIEVELAEMQRQLMENREAEQLRLARELYDGPMQELYSVFHRLSRLREAGLNETDLTQLATAQTALQQIIQTLQTTFGALEPLTFIPFGLEKAIRFHIERFQIIHPELEIGLGLVPDGQLLPERLRLALFHVYEEALNNVVQYAAAQYVLIRFTWDTQQVTLEIQDDGQGFELPKYWIELARQGHLGLIRVAELVKAIGGRLRITSKPGEGTLVQVLVPLLPRQDEADHKATDLKAL